MMLVPALFILLAIMQLLYLKVLGKIYLLLITRLSELMFFVWFDNQTPWIILEILW